jgi:hypothetical protein
MGRICSRHESSGTCLHFCLEILKELTCRQHVPFTADLQEKCPTNNYASVGIAGSYFAETYIICLQCQWEGRGGSRYKLAGTGGLEEGPRPDYIAYFFLNNQPDAPIVQISSVIKLYMFQASSLPIIRSFLLYIEHWWVSCSNFHKWVKLLIYTCLRYCSNITIYILVILSIY